MSREAARRLIRVGRVSGVYGVRGWLRIFSYTEPHENIIRYPRWYLELKGKRGEHRVAEGRSHGKGVVVRLEGCDDRDQAMALIGSEILIERDELPALADNEFYWTDLQGMQVVNRRGERLGVVESLLETGSNDVLVVVGERERLIPFVLQQTVLKVERESREIVVDWDKDF